MRHLVAGAADDPQADRQAEMFARQIAALSPRRVQLWWVCSREQPIAVALTLTSLGHVGFLYHSPASLPGVEEKALVSLIRAINTATLRRQADLVQAMIESPHDADERILRAAGMEPLADLISMECESPRCTSAESKRWRFIDHRRFRCATLIETLCRTYEDTLDCPRLQGLRSPKDILSSHRSTGAYRPRWWWLAMDEGKPAGCILVNAALNDSAAVVVYMGVVKEYRGRRLGEAMLHHAQQHTQREGVQRLQLSVDADNRHAKRCYERFGFVETGRKRCFTVFSPRGGNHCE